jgi:outer membrane immunogenic protein
MRHAISICAATALLGCASAAFAADMPARMPLKAPVAPIVAAYNWSGFYIGGHVGGVWGDKDWRDDVGVSLGSHDVSGFLGGGQIGFNVQSGNWVFGIEGQASWTNADGRHDTPTVFFTTEVKWLGTIAGRIGWAQDRLLLYVKGGAAFARDEHAVGTNVTIVFANTTLNPGQVLWEGDKTRWGWMVGAGLEYGLSPNWSAKIEYNYMDFGDKDITFHTVAPLPPLTTVFNIDQRMHVVKAGINYRFGGGPVIAGY